MIVTNDLYVPEAQPFSKREISMLRQDILELDDYLQQTPDRRRRATDYPRFPAVLRDALAEIVADSPAERLESLIIRQGRRVLQRQDAPDADVQMARYISLRKTFVDRGYTAKTLV